MLGEIFAHCTMEIPCELVHYLLNFTKKIQVLTCQDSGIRSIADQKQRRTWKEYVGKIGT